MHHFIVSLTLQNLLGPIYERADGPQRLSVHHTELPIARDGNDLDVQRAERSLGRQWVRSEYKERADHADTAARTTRCA